jgi:hypothetical protein
LQFENHDNHNKLLPNDLYECCGIWILNSFDSILSFGLS